MLLNAFKCDNRVYSIQLSDIGVADAGDDALYVYCHRQYIHGLLDWCLRISGRCLTRLTSLIKGKEIAHAAIIFSGWRYST